MKRIIGTSLIWLGNGLIGLAVLAIATGVIYGWYVYGFSWVRETLSPFNVWNVIATVIVLAPGVGIRTGGQKLVDMAGRGALSTP
jgi:hypothetical protein